MKQLPALLIGVLAAVLAVIAALALGLVTGGAAMQGVVFAGATVLVAARLGAHPGMTCGVVTTLGHAFAQMQMGGAAGFEAVPLLVALGALGWVTGRSFEMIRAQRQSLEQQGLELRRQMYQMKKKGLRDSTVIEVDVKAAVRALADTRSGSTAIARSRARTPDAPVPVVCPAPAGDQSVLLDGITIIANALNEKRVLEASLKSIHYALNATRATIHLHERRTDGLLRGETLPAGAPLAPGSAEPAIRLALRKRSLLARHRAEGEVAHAFAAAPDLSFVAPLFDRAMIAGAILVHGAQAESGQCEERLEILATATGLALSAARLAQRCEERTRLDVLTGLPGVDEIREVLEERLGRGGCAVLLIGADGLRDVNELYGRHEGDKTVAALAKFVAIESGPDASVGRYGGATLLVVLTGQRVEAALALAERVKRRVPTAMRAGPEGLARPLTVSIGVGAAAVGPADALLQETERALAVASAKGNAIEVAGRDEVPAQPEGVG